MNQNWTWSLNENKKKNQFEIGIISYVYPKNCPSSTLNDFGNWIAIQNDYEKREGGVCLGFVIESEKKLTYDKKFIWRERDSILRVHG